MKKIYIPANKPEDWAQLLADPIKHWELEHSAAKLAYSWQNADGFPKEVKKVFNNSGILIFHDLELLFAFPEYKVPLLGGSRASQNDLYVVARNEKELFSIAVEGKVTEPFGDYVQDWLKKQDEKTSKQNRYDYLVQKLHLQNCELTKIRYQLMHRTVSALLCAEKIFAKNAVMLVHSFSPSNQWFEDYQEFLNLYHLKAEVDKIVGPFIIEEINLYFGWIKGE